MVFKMDPEIGRDNISVEDGLLVAFTNINYSIKEDHMGKYLQFSTLWKGEVMITGEWNWLGTKRITQCVWVINIYVFSVQYQV